MFRTAVYYKPEIKKFVLEIIPQLSLHSINLMIQGYLFLDIYCMELIKYVINRYLSSGYERQEDIWTLAMTCHILTKLKKRENYEIAPEGFMKMIVKLKELQPTLLHNLNFSNLLQVHSALFTIDSTVDDSNFYPRMLSNYPSLSEKLDHKGIVYLFRTIYYLPLSLFTPELKSSLMKTGQKSLNLYLEKLNKISDIRINEIAYDFGTITYFLQVVAALDNHEELKPKQIDSFLTLLPAAVTNRIHEFDITSISRLNYFLNYIKWKQWKEYKKHKVQIEDFLVKSKTSIINYHMPDLRSSLKNLEENPSTSRLLVEKIVESLFDSKTVEKEKVIEMMFVDLYTEVDRELFDKLFPGSIQPHAIAESTSEIKQKSNESSIVSEKVKLVIEVHGQNHFFRPTGQLRLKDILKTKMLEQMGYKVTFIHKSTLIAASRSFGNDEKIMQMLLDDMRNNMDSSKSFYNSYTNKI